MTVSVGQWLGMGGGGCTGYGDGCLDGDPLGDFGDPGGVLYSARLITHRVINIKGGHSPGYLKHMWDPK